MPTDKSRSDRRQGGRRPRGPAHGVHVRRTKSGDGWVLVHPRCALDRAEDFEEVAGMIRLGATDVAIDELRWLIGGCSEFMEAHQVLGELALSEDSDIQLARGHFGFAYQLGLTALRRAGSPRPLPYRLPPNRPFFEAGKNLARCLSKLDKAHMAREVLQQLLHFDPTDPLGIKEQLKASPRNT